MFVDSEIYLLHGDNLSSLEGRKHEDLERVQEPRFLFRYVIFKPHMMAVMHKMRVERE